MKYRNGFVSNSSSSSFVIVGNRIEFDNIKLKDITNIQIIMNGFDEPCQLKMDKEIYDYIKNNKELIEEISMEFFKFIASGIDEITINKEDMPETVNVYTLTVDQHSPEGIEQFKNFIKLENEE